MALTAVTMVGSSDVGNWPPASVWLTSDTIDAALSAIASNGAMNNLVPEAFGIEIPRSELFPEDVLTNAEYVQNGKVTEGGLVELRKRMPFADLSRFEKNPAVQEFGNLLTVSDLCRYVESKVGAA